MKSTRSLITKHCANWNDGICLGGMIKCEIIKNKKTSVAQWIDKKLYNKPCIVLKNKNCSYWRNIVVRGMTNEQGI